MNSRVDSAPRNWLVLLWLGVPWFMAAIGDAALLWRTGSDVLDGAFLAEVAAQWFMQSAAVAGLLAVLWTVANFVPAVFGAGKPQRESRFYAGALAVALLVLDHAVYSDLFTHHWTVAPIHVASALIEATALILYLRQPVTTQVWLRQKLWIVSVLLGFAALCTVLVFGFSVLPVTPKYLREPIAALILQAFVWFWLVVAMSYPLRQPGRLATTCVVGLMVWLGATTAAAQLSQRSCFLVVTNLEATRAFRNLNRHFAWLAPFRKMPWLARYAGERRTPEFNATLEPFSPHCTRVNDSSVRSFLLISVDALRADYYGVPMDELPAFSKLQQESVLFLNAIQAASGTSASFYAFHTGQFPIVGPPLDVLWSLHNDLDFETAVIAQDQDVASLTNEALARLREWGKEGAPFFLHVHYLSLHLPAGLGRGHHNYANALREVDVELGRLLGQLETLGLEETTMVVVTADHGEELWTERGYESHGYGTTMTLLHTPLMIRIPGRAAETRPEFVSGVDILPTAFDQLGVRCDYDMHGRNLLGDLSADRAVFSSSMSPSPVLQDVLRYSDIHTVLKAPWKLVFNRGENALALYNIVVDPMERVNLVDTEPKQVETLMNLLDEYLSGRLEVEPEATRD